MENQLGYVKPEEYISDFLNIKDSAIYGNE